MAAGWRTQNDLCGAAARPLRCGGLAEKPLLGEEAVSLPVVWSCGVGIVRVKAGVSALTAKEAAGLTAPSPSPPVSVTVPVGASGRAPLSASLIGAALSVVSLGPDRTSWAAVTGPDRVPFVGEEEGSRFGSEDAGRPADASASLPEPLAAGEVALVGASFAGEGSSIGAAASAVSAGVAGAISGTIPPDSCPS
jgi:hypothetical protein